MTKLIKYIILIVLVSVSIKSNAQDTVYVYLDNGLVRIDNLQQKPLFLTPNSVTMRLKGNEFILNNGLTSQEYNIGTYDEIFNYDTVGYATQESAINYLSSIINLATTDVFINNQITPPFQYYLMFEEKDDITLTENAYIDSSFVLVSSGHGFTGTGERIVIMENNRYVQAEVKSTSNDTVYLYNKIASVFTTNATVIRGNIDMNVDGSSVDSVYVCLLRNNFTIPMDIKTIQITMQHTTAGDKSKFGNIAALTNGLLVRKENTQKFNLGNYKNNNDFDELGAIVTFDDKAGGGNYSTTIVFNLEDIYGIVIRLNPRESDSFNVRVRDDLSSLVRLRISIMGHYTTGE